MTRIQSTIYNVTSNDLQTYISIMMLNKIDDVK